MSLRPLGVPLRFNRCHPKAAAAQALRSFSSPLRLKNAWPYRYDRIPQAVSRAPMPRFTVTPLPAVRDPVRHCCHLGSLTRWDGAEAPPGVGLRLLVP